MANLPSYQASGPHDPSNAAPYPRGWPISSSTNPFSHGSPANPFNGRSLHGSPTNPFSDRSSLDSLTNPFHDESSYGSSTNPFNDNSSTPGQPHSDGSGDLITIYEGHGLEEDQTHQHAYQPFLSPRSARFHHNSKPKPAASPGANPFLLGCTDSSTNPFQTQQGNPDAYWQISHVPPPYSQPTLQLPNTSYQRPHQSTYNQPNIRSGRLNPPKFSGAIPPRAGEVDYVMWRRTVQKIMNDDPRYPAGRLVESLLGSALMVVLAAHTAVDIVAALDEVYLIEDTPTQLQSDLYTATQRVGETAQEYYILRFKVLKLNSRSTAFQDAQMRAIFWRGLRDSSVKLALYYKYDGDGSTAELMVAVTAFEIDHPPQESTALRAHHIDFNDHM